MINSRNKRARDGKRSNWEEKSNRDSRIKEQKRKTESRKLESRRLESRKSEPREPREQNYEPISKTILHGRNAVLEAITSGRSIDKILIKDGETEGSIRSIFAKAKEQGIKIEKVTKKVLDSLSGEASHQGIIAFVPAVEYSTMGDIFNRAKEKEAHPFIIILNNITDPHNFGAIVRSAEAAGAHGIIIPNRRNASITATVEKTSAGAINHIPIVRVSNIASTIDQLKKNNIWIVGTDMGGTNYFNMNLKGPIAICIGGEGEGLGNLIQKKCDYIASIPMHGNITSLNASVASALVMYEVVKQRSQ